MGESNKNQKTVNSTVGSSQTLSFPSSYVSRTVVQVAPKYKLQGLAIFDPSYQYPNPSYSLSIALKSPRYDEKHFITVPTRNKLRFIYALPGHGSTTFMISELINLQNFLGTRQEKRWTNFLNLKTVIKTLSSRNLVLTSGTWTLSKLFIEYFNINDSKQQSHIEKIFPSVNQPTENVKEKKIKMGTTPGKVEGVFAADLFLDEIDELSSVYQKIILQLLKTTDWKKSTGRVWVACRPHIKPIVDEVIEEDGVIISSFELRPFERDDQMLVLLKSLTAMSTPVLPTCNRKAATFANDLFYALEFTFPNFYKTLGPCPSHLTKIADFFFNTFFNFLKDSEKDSKCKPDVLSFNHVELFDFLVKAKFDTHLDQWMAELPEERRPKDDTAKERILLKECRRLERYHVKFAMSSYKNDYSSTDKESIFQSLSPFGQQKLENELFSLGLLYEINGKLQFRHKKYAEFLLAKYFVNNGNFKYTPADFISFFHNNIMFEEEFKGVRKYFNDYWALQQIRNKIRMAGGFGRLRKFLAQEYSLTEEDEKAQKEAGFQHNSYESRKDKGSILHLTLFERNLHIYEMILHSFRPHPKQLEKLMSITVQMELLEDNSKLTNWEMTNVKFEYHSMSTFHLFALLAKGSKEMIERLIKHNVRIVNRVQLLENFQEGSWTPYHYAAISSNYNFLSLAIPFFSQKKILNADLTSKNPKGQEAIHMVLASQCYYYSIKILKPSQLRTNEGCSETNETVDTPEPAPTASSSNQDQQIIVQEVAAEVEVIAETVEVEEMETEHENEKGNAKGEDEKQKQPEKEYYDGVWSFEGTIKDFNSGKWSYDEEMEMEEGQNGNSNEPVKNEEINEHFKVLDLLRNNGCRVNTPQGKDGKTLLHFAGEYKSPPLINYLLEQGADREAKDDNGKMPKLDDEDGVKVEDGFPYSLLNWSF